MRLERIRRFLSLCLCVTIVIGGFSVSDSFNSALNKVIASIIYGNASKYAVNAEASFNTKTEIYSSTGYSSGKYTATPTNVVSADMEALKAQAQELFKDYTKAGSINETQMGRTSKTVFHGVVEVDNKTNESINLKSVLAKKPSLKKITEGKPSILIYHTHSTEGYELLDLGWYAKEYDSRTKDTSKNIVRVGEELAFILEAEGFEVIHDKNIYDTSYNGAYSRSRVSVERLLKKYPSIQITLDVHRDAIHYDDGTRCKPTVTINGKKAAQIMIISGCEGDGVENFPSWQKNLVFATHLQGAAEEKYNGLMRPVFFCYRKYNMDVTPCSLLLEFGTDANTLEEAVYSAQLIGKALAEMLEDYI